MKGNAGARINNAINSAVNTVKSWFGGGGQTKVNTESTLNNAKGSKGTFNLGDKSPSGNGIIKEILGYKPNGDYPNDNAGNVYITDSNKADNKKFWKQFEGNLSHWYDESIITKGPRKGQQVLSKDLSEYMFDISNKKHRGGQGDYFGPNSEFTVKYAGLIPGYGGAMVLGDKKGNQYTLGHFSEINSKVMDAYKSGKPLSPGTYLGETNSTIGSSTGPHAHGQTTSMKRDKMLENFINEKK
jgi:hypothetical protein